MPASRFGTPRKYPCASTLRSNSFSFTHFRKNASATPLVSHSFKTKDLKSFRFTHFQKKGRGEGGRPDKCSGKNASASPLDSALTSKRAAKSFTSNTYEKHTQGEGGCLLARPLLPRLPVPPIPLPPQPLRRQHDLAELFPPFQDFVRAAAFGERQDAVNHRPK